MKTIYLQPLATGYDASLEPTIHLATVGKPATVLARLPVDEHDRPYTSVTCLSRVPGEILRCLQGLCRYYQTLQGAMPIELVMHWEMALLLASHGCYWIEIEDVTIPFKIEAIEPHMLLARGKSWVC